TVRVGGRGVPLLPDPADAGGGGGAALPAIRRGHVREGAPVPELADRYLRPRNRHGAWQAVAVRRGIPIERAGGYAGGGGGAGRPRVRRARNVRAPSVLEPLVTVCLVALFLVLAAGTVSAQEQFYYLGNPDDDA